MSPVTVTGGSGYLGTQLIAALLCDGCRVRTTVRSPEREGDVRAAVRRGDADDSRLEVVTAELTTDVADLHIRAMAAPGAAGQRYLALADGPTISFLQLAQILRERLGLLAKRVPAEEAPGPEPARLIIHNARAKQELGWRPRPAGTTIVETAESLRDLGLLEER